MLRVDLECALAFRLSGHHLSLRLPAGSLLEAAASCGIQDSPPGSAATALFARVQELTPAAIDQALAVDRTLLQAWSMRGSPVVFPTDDLPVFTLGLRPQDEESQHAFIAGLLDPMITEAGMTVSKLEELAAKAVLEALDGHVLTKRQLGAELQKRMPAQLRRWFEPHTFFAANLVRLVSLRGVLCFAPRVGNEASFVRIDQWLDRSPPKADPAQARAELVRRFLRCYGPSTPAHFAEWAGMALSDASSSWGSVEPDLVEVSLDGRRCWLHRNDVAALESPGTARGVRLLPPHDMFLFQRDRAALISDVSRHKMVWRSAGNPGVVLVDGRVVGAWRPQKKGNKLLLAVMPFSRLDAAAREEIEEEAVAMAPFREANTVEVRFGDVL